MRWVVWLRDRKVTEIGDEPQRVCEQQQGREGAADEDAESQDMWIVARKVMTGRPGATPFDCVRRSIWDIELQVGSPADTRGVFSNVFRSMGQVALVLCLY